MAFGDLSVEFLAFEKDDAAIGIGLEASIAKECVGNGNTHEFFRDVGSLPT